MSVPATQPSVPARAAILALKIYKRLLSPVFYAFGARCRHAPSCADYALDSFRRHGAVRGFWLSFARLSRCHPFGSHGWDPPPETLPDHGWRLWRYGDWAWTERKAADE
ncbi:MAG: membrane protein insertion efficiency factor YidD [Parvularculaceae bacterium]|nr:membrane protein insertion efficiency factor YidD [Parvularculaceae bacterium]